MELTAPQARLPVALPCRFDVATPVHSSTTINVRVDSIAGRPWIWVMIRSSGFPDREPLLEAAMCCLAVDDARLGDASDLPSASSTAAACFAGT